jgi:hypothetical protein
MTSLQWHDPTEKQATTHEQQSGSDPWFGVAMGLLGIIVGYLIGTF